MLLNDLTSGAVELGGNTTFVGVNRRARLMGKSLTISTLVLLLSILYLFLIGLLAPRFDLPGAPVGHMLATVLIAVHEMELARRFRDIANVKRVTQQSDIEVVQLAERIVGKTPRPDKH